MSGSGTVRPGLSATVRHEVGESDTARALGSGSLDVLGTPRLLAWMEAATCTAITPYLADGDTSVGTRVSVEHLRASAVGAAVTVSATVVYVDGRLIRFEVAASGEDWTPVASGSVTRVVVGRERFLARL